LPHTDGGLETALEPAEFVVRAAFSRRRGFRSVVVPKGQREPSPFSVGAVLLPHPS
jgi:hypothetical protein